MVPFAYFPAGRQLWMDLARDLADAAVAKPVIWLGDKSHDTEAQAAFPDCAVIDNAAIFNGILPNDSRYDGALSGFWTSPNHARALDRAIKMLDRVDRLTTLRPVTRSAFFEALVMWALTLVRDRDPQFLLMSETPHSPAAYVLHEVMSFLERPVYCFQSWSLAPALVMRRGLPGDALPVAAGVPRRQVDLEALGNAVREQAARLEMQSGGEYIYMQSQQRREARAGLGSPLARLVPTWPARQHRPDFFSADRLSQLAYGRKWRTRKERTQALIVALRQLVVTDLPERFVYVPLHYEPERTTNPDGGEFHDQLRMIAALRAWLPREITIVVKEHPSQLMVRNKGFQGRSPAFYRAVARIANTVLIDPAFPSADLISKSRMVATVTGTAALEAAWMGKPALTFGLTWFEGCPNVFRYADGPVPETLIGGSVMPHGAVTDWLLSRLQEFTVPGCINPSNEAHFASFYAAQDFYLAERTALVAQVSSVLRAELVNAATA